jgi:hypothetical protein
MTLRLVLCRSFFICPAEGAPGEVFQFHDSVVGQPTTIQHLRIVLTACAQTAGVRLSHWHLEQELLNFFAMNFVVTRLHKQVTELEAQSSLR